MRCALGRWSVFRHATRALDAVRVVRAWRRWRAGRDAAAIRRALDAWRAETRLACEAKRRLARRVWLRAQPAGYVVL